MRGRLGSWITDITYLTGLSWQAAVTWANIRQQRPDIYPLFSASSSRALQIKLITPRLICGARGCSRCRIYLQRWGLAFWTSARSRCTAMIGPTLLCTGSMFLFYTSVLNGQAVGTRGNILPQPSYHFKEWSNAGVIITFLLPLGFAVVNKQHKTPTICDYDRQKIFSYEIPNRL